MTPAELREQVGEVVFDGRGRARVATRSKLGKRRQGACSKCGYSGLGMPDGRCPFCNGTMQATSKYGNRRKVTLDRLPGRSFDSQREANRAAELLILQDRGEIVALEFQVPILVVLNGEKVCKYIADFRYEDPRTGARTYEDSKGMRTPIYKLKKKLVHAVYGIEIVET